MSEEEVVIETPPGTTVEDEAISSGQMSEMEWGEVTVLERPEAPAPGTQEKLRVAVMGENYLADATRVVFDPKLADVTAIQDLEQVVEMRPALVFVCSDVPLLKNESIDDAELIKTIATLAKQTKAGVCLKTTVNVETLDRIAQASGAAWFLNKFVYSPEITETAEEMLVCDYHMIGGGPDVVDKHEELMLRVSTLIPRQIVKGTHNEIAFTKMAISGYKAVKQTFFNQLHQAIIDIEGANPSIVRRNIESCPELNDNRVMIPTFVRAQLDGDVTLKQARSFAGEYANTDVKMFASMTDRLTVLEECINLRNLKD